MQKEVKIKCPYCEREYLIGEIYIPNLLVGQPTHISRDYMGKILFHEGTSPDFDEQYTCDECKKTFGINIKMTASTTKISK